MACTRDLFAFGDVLLCFTQDDRDGVFPRLERNVIFLHQPALRGVLYVAFACCG